MYYLMYLVGYQISSIYVLISTISLLSTPIIHNLFEYHNISHDFALGRFPDFPFHPHKDIPKQKRQRWRVRGIFLRVCCGWHLRFLCQLLFQIRLCHDLWLPAEKCSHNVFWDFHNIRLKTKQPWQTNQKTQEYLVLTYHVSLVQFSSLFVH